MGGVVSAGRAVSPSFWLRAWLLGVSLRAAVGVFMCRRKRGAWLVSINMLKAGNMHVCDSKTPECLT